MRFLWIDFRELGHLDRDFYSVLLVKLLYQFLPLVMCLLCFVALVLPLVSQSARPSRQPETLAVPSPSPYATKGVSFRDITQESGLASFRHVAGSPTKPYLPDTTGSGVALFDYDNDGWLDVYLVNALSPEARQGRVSKSRAALFRNNHNGSFADVTLKAGTENESWGTGVCAGDFNNDGWEDLFVANFGKSRLYRNNGDGTFTDVAEQTGVQVDSWSTGCAFGDYNKDGFLDLYVAAYVRFDWNNPPPSADGEAGPAEKSAAASRGAAYDPGRAYCDYQGVRVACGPIGLPPAPDFLFRNNEGKSFADVTKEANVSPAKARYGFAVAWVDVDADGWLDLVVANDSDPNYLYHNNGDGTFEEMGLLSGLGTDANGRAQAYMGLASGDFNHDGRPDFFLTTFSSDHFSLYQNLGALAFADVTLVSGLGIITVPFLGWGAEFFDHDNDGSLDLLVANGHIYPQVEGMNWNTSYLQRTLLFRNLPGGKFADVSGSLGEGFTKPKSSRGAAVGDLFNDGDLDVVLNNLDSQPTVLENHGGNRAGHWLQIKLVGDPSQRTPRDAIGSVVFCSAGGIRQRGEVASGRGYISQSDLRVHFGLGSATRVDKLEVAWPNGLHEIHEVATVDRLVTIEQGKEKGIP